MNETQIMKNIFANITNAIIFLNVDRLILIIDIFFFNELKNFEKYMTLFQSLNWWNENFLKKLKIIFENNNSYILSNNHSSVKLRFINIAINEFIIKSFIDNFIKNKYLRQIYKNLLLKRIYAFKLSFDNSRILNEYLFRVQWLQIECILIETKQKIYIDIEKRFFTQLIQKIKKKHDDLSL